MNGPARGGTDRNHDRQCGTGQWGAGGEIQRER
jgi:hypothetical protein